MGLNQFLAIVTVEPIVILFYLANTMTLFLSQDIFKHKTCHLEFNLSSSLCLNQTALAIYSYATNSTILTDIYKETSKWYLYHNILNTIPAMIITIFMGSWSDQFGRKIPMLFPVCGVMFSVIILLINIIYIDLPMAMLLINGIPFALSGGLATLMMSVLSYIADITDVKSRTFRISLIEVLIVISATVSILIGGQFQLYIGEIGTFVFILGIDIIIIIYIIIRIENKSPKKTKDKIQCNCLNLFTLQNVTESLKTSLKKRKYHIRIHIWFLIITVFLLTMARSGELDIIVLHSEAPPINWSYVQVTYFIFFRGISLGVFTALGIGLFKNLLKFHDVTIAFIGSISKIAICFVGSFAVQTWLIYLSGVLGVFDSMPAAVSRAYISKIVNKDEQGKIFSLISSAEAIAPLIATALYNTVFAYTVSKIPSVSFLISTGVGIFCAVTYLVIYFTTSKAQKLEIENYDLNLPPNLHSSTGQPLDHLSQKEVQHIST